MIASGVKIDLTASQRTMMQFGKLKNFCKRKNVKLYWFCFQVLQDIFLSFEKWTNISFSEIARYKPWFLDDIEETPKPLLEVLITHGHTML